ncbi:hypothetical protein N7540_012490 [Penicillium herquei]|nr:hypothetical protein N7540_012490 [Penicillium herquei]
MLQTSILHLPTEVFWNIASSLDGSEISALARTCKTIYPKLRLALIKYNVKYQSGSALHWAARNNKVAFAKILIAYQAGVNEMIHGASPLVISTKYGSELVLDLLLRNRKIRVNDVGENGKGALWYAVSNKAYNMVKKLLQHPNIDINILNHEGQNILWPAVSQADKDMVRLLLLKGVSLEVFDHQRETLLHRATYKGFEEMVDLLLTQSNTLLNYKDRNGRTALWISTYMAHANVTTRLLKEPNVDVNTLARCSEYNIFTTSLHHMVSLLWPSSLREFLTMSSLDPNVCKGSQSALWMAIKEGNTTAIQLLIRHEKTQINAICSDEDSPLHVATDKEDLTTVELLVRQNDRLQINQVNRDDGDSALFLAIRRRRQDILEVLLSHPHINLDVTNRWQETALEVAVRFGTHAMVEKLLQGPRLPRKFARSVMAAKSRDTRDLIRRRMNGLA